MTVITGKDARRFKERQGWLIAGAIAAAVLMGARHQVESDAIRLALAVGAFLAVVIAVWRFNRGRLEPETKPNQSSQPGSPRRDGNKPTT